MLQQFRSSFTPASSTSLPGTMKPPGTASTSLKGFVASSASSTDNRSQSITGGSINNHNKDTNKHKKDQDKDTDKEKERDKDKDKDRDRNRDRDKDRRYK